jgi:hypothetical protein
MKNLRVFASSVSSSNCEQSRFALKALLRSPASVCGLLIIGFAVGISVGVARSDHPSVPGPGRVSDMLAQAAPPPPGTSPDKPADTAGVDMAAVERAIDRAAKAAFDKAAAEAVERIHKATQRIGEFDKLRNEIKTEISEVRAQMLTYAIWGGVAFFGLMVLASVLGGAIVAALFRKRRHA